MLDHLRQDLAHLARHRGGGSRFFLIECLLFENGFQAVVLYRLAHAFKRRRIPFFGPFFCRLAQLLTGVEIAPGAVIGPGLVISHGHGIVIGQWTRIGRDALLHQQVTLGAKDTGRLDEMPRLGDGVVLGAGAKLLGGLEVGDGAVVGPNAFVTRDVPAGGKALAPYAEIRAPRS